MLPRPHVSDATPAEAAQAPAPPPSGHRSARRGRLRPILLRALAALAAVLVVLVAAAAIFMWSLPATTDAGTRVDHIVVAHHGTIHPMPPPAKLGDSVVAVEDEHFYSNVFFDVAAGATRAALATVRSNGDPGGSTIVQQLAKQIYPHSHNLVGKLEEIGLGVKLALTYSKPRLLNMYLNAVYFGNGYWGQDAAARGYFGTVPSRLDWAQASLLAGLVQAPSAYDPIHHLSRAKARQHHVLSQLVANRYLTTSQAKVVFAAPLGLR